MREILSLDTVPSHIIQSMKDLAVVAGYLHQNLGGMSIAEVISSEGHNGKGRGHG